MTVEVTTSKVSANGNGVATSFSFSPLVLDASSDLTVTKIDAAGTQSPLTENTDYTVVVSSYPGTGSITYPATGSTKLATGEKLVMKPVVPLTQTMALDNQGGYFPDTQERAFDKLTRIAIQQQETINRGIRFNIADTDAPIDLPEAADRAGKVLAFDDDGQPTASTVETGTLVSAPMAAVVGAATLAAARTALGSTTVGDAVFAAANAAAARTALGLGAAAVEALGADIVDDGSGNLTTKVIVNAQTVQNYPIVAADRNKLVTRTNASAMGDTLPNANTLPAGWKTDVKVLATSASASTITPSTSTIDGLAAIVVQPGRGVRIFSDGTNYLVEWLSERRDYVKLSYTVSSGTAGGASSAGTQNQRPLNTKDADTAGICTLSSNQFTLLTAGTFEFREVGNVFNPGSRFRPRLRNVTDSATTLLGVGGATAANTHGQSRIDGRFTITASKTFEIDEYTQGSEASDGLGVAISSGENEVHTTVELWRL